MKSAKKHSILLSAALYLIILLTSNHTYAQNTIEIDEQLSSYTFKNADIHLLQDKDGILTIDEILQDSYQKRFIPNEKSNINLGFVEDAYWFKIKITNKASINEKYFLEIPYFNLDYITLYQKDKNGNWQATKSGDKRPFSQRLIKHIYPVFEINFNSEPIQEYYIRVQTKGAIQLPIMLQSLEGLRADEFSRNTFFIFFYGAMVIMFLYNLFIYFSARDLNYLLYSLSIITFVFNQINLTGYGLLLWGDHIWWANMAIHFFNFTYLATTYYFILKFLEIKKYSKILYWIYSILIGANLLFIVGLATLLLSYKTMTILGVAQAVLLPLLVVSTGALVLIKGRKSARFFVFGWFFYMVGIFFFALKYLVELPNNLYLQNASLIGALIEVIFVAFALADKINIYRKEKEEAQAKNISLIQSQKSELEQKVLERTQDLNQKQEEVLAQNRELALKNTQIEHSIRAANYIQQAILPSEKKMASAFGDHFVIYKPKDIVSGDFYWLTKRENEIWAIAADCTGHGVPGAFMTLLGNNLFDKLINVNQIESPAEVLKKLDEEIKASLSQEENRGLQGMDLAIAKIDYKTDDDIEVTFSGAKSPLYLYSTDDNRIKKYKGDRANIGGETNHGEKEFTNQSFIASRNDKLYMGSDGYQNQNNIDRKRFGSSNLKNLLEDIALKPFSEQKEILNNTLNNHMEATDQRDDILVMGIEL